MFYRRNTVRCITCHYTVKNKKCFKWDKGFLRKYSDDNMGSKNICHFGAGLGLLLNLLL